ncbi:CD209 antigen-like protein E isoform X1 [Lepisosteus oculatus]|uniref:CD209 antigen-like protein E isoform X1 n=1 Tax=Lepisosteus oculatus TaxID=7918 RepID=UPI0035F50FA8
MDTDSVYTGLQKPAQDVYETVTRRAEREPGGEQTRQSRSRSCVSISLGVTVCVLLVTVIALGTVLWKQNSSDWERKLEKKEKELEEMKSELERNQNKSETHRSEAERYRKQLEKFCVEPSTGKRKEQCCPEGWKEGDCGRCYYVSTDQRPWKSANQSCSSMGAQLVVIDDKSELELLGRLVKDNNYYWIGLSRKDLGSEWRWVDGRDLDKEVVTVDTSYYRYCGYWNPGQKTVYPRKCEETHPWICEGDAVRV